MTDQPQGPTDPPREGAQVPPPDAAPQPPAATPPPHQPGQPAGPPTGFDPRQPWVPVEQRGGYGYGAPPAYAPVPQPEPYGGYAPAPGYAGGRPMHPGSIGYVEQNFGPVADFGKRALAYLIDLAITLIGLIPMIIGIVLLIVAAPSDVTYDEFGNATTSGGDAGLALGTLVSLGIWLWNRVFRMGRTGQSVGKRAIGLRLLDDKTGQPIGAGMCFLREVVSNIVNQVFYLSFLWMLWDTDKQTLADKAVHSSVIVVPKG
jgi:uncharacterized RDD family membrane protein YckC